MTHYDNDSFAFTDERFADIQMLRYRLDGWDTLTLQQKKYAYCLAQATIAGRDIIYQQLGHHNLNVRKTLEKAWSSYRGDRNDPQFIALETYLKRVWFANGIHHHYAGDKFQPEFTPDFLRKLTDVDDELIDVIFNPQRLPRRDGNPDAPDRLDGASITFYEGITQQEAEKFYRQMKAGATEEAPSFGLNSTLSKRNGLITEDVWRIGGRYGTIISRICQWLKEASQFAENQSQRDIIAMLVDYYETGSLTTFDEYSIAWLQETEGRIDFINGFIEVYDDPLAIKGSWEGIVHYKDLEASKRTATLCREAQWFEDHAPTDPRFKKSCVKGVTASAVNAAMLGGDNYPASAIGINLPNADWIRARHGSKSITIGNLTEAYRMAKRESHLWQEFADTPATVSMIERYGALTDLLHTDLHECLGHGSGKVIDGGAFANSEHHSALEEARADLFALYYMADPKMLELKLLPDSEAWRALYYTYMANGLMVQLARIEPNRRIEEAHMRARALIARWCFAKGGAMRMVSREGTTRLVIDDYSLLRQHVAELLAEVQRIKSCGDNEAGAALIHQYAIDIDPTLHREIRQRYSALGIAPYKGFINPHMMPVRDASGAITDIRLDYSESYAQQMMRYGKL